MVTGTTEVDVVQENFLVPVGLFDGTVHVEDDLVGQAFCLEPYRFIVWAGSSTRSGSSVR